MHKLSSVPDYGRTFPLYVPPIDWYFLSDDSPQFPMSFFLDLDFSGQLDRGKFEEAYGEALGRHPLLYCIAAEAKNDRLCWVLAPDKVPDIDWADGDSPLVFENDGFIDIRQTTGVKVWVRQSSDSARVTMQIHHAACDGTGAYRFVGDLLGCYMKRLACCEGKVELAEFDAAQLKVRRSKMRSILMHESSWKKLHFAMSECWKLVGKRISPLKPPANNPTHQVLPGMVKQDFSAEQLANLRGAATAKGGTLNDLFLCKVFESALRWNNDAGKRIRILVPADMRDGDDFEIPACNMTACTFITRDSAEIRDEERLMKEVLADTLEIKNGTPQSAFVNMLTTAMEGSMLPRILNRNWCLATCVFSNAGDPARRFTGRLPKKKGKISCDDFTLEGITGVPPLRRNTRATLSSSIYGRKLTFSLRCDPHLFDEDASNKLLEVFCDQLRPLANGE
ncbi:MAG: hypothetical protein AAFX06_19750 [Planctomycetota bacterium]